jgi:serine/threonine protein kinase
MSSSNNSTRYGVFDPGFRIDDDLTVIEHLGGSRKVDIYLCRSKAHKDLVACKVLNARYTIDFSSLEAVMQEGEILNEMRHPNVIEGYDVELEPYPRVTMEYLGGQTISTTFFQGNWEAFNPEDFIGIGVQLADALEYIHSKGYVHLDVKPSNVMYDDGHVTLFDFSVAEEYTLEDSLRDNAGTVEYMAPEQTYRREIGYATDVFGAGVVLYELLTGGEAPYPVVHIDDPDERRGYRRELDYSEPPSPPSEHNSTIWPELDSVALQSIESDYDSRIQSPSALRSALSNALDRKR